MQYLVIFIILQYQNHFDPDSEQIDSWNLDECILQIDGFISSVLSVRQIKRY